MNPSVLRALVVLLCMAGLPGCVVPVDPLGPIAKSPRSGVKMPEPRLSEKFAWGISTASYQYEDPAVKPGDPDYFQTDWDLFSKEGKAPPRGNALFSWTHFDRDLEAIKKIGVTHYRFGIEWSRVEPRPGEYNEAAIRGYVEMARKLKAAGIEPVVCLWHFTFPSWLYEKGHPSRSNWLHPDIRVRWNAYVEKMARALAPHVRYFAPQNEPNGEIATAYLLGQWPPAMSFGFGHYWKAIDVSTTLFRDAAAKIRAIRPGAKILSIEAIAWWQKSWMDPGRFVFNVMKHDNVDHLDRVYDVCDILGINYYYSQSAGLPSLLSEPYRRGRNYTMMGWRVNSSGMYKEIHSIGKRYGKPMMITENGIATSNDAQRIWYMKNHIAAVGQAIKDGYDVRGYFAWSLADNYEWHYGYKALFGMTHMDPASCERVFKPSAYKYAAIIRKHPTVGSLRRVKAQADFVPR